MCTPVFESPFTPDGYPYTLQRSYSNRAAKTGTDPCVPRSGSPLAVAVPKLPDMITIGSRKNRGLVVAPGTNGKVDIELFAEDGALIDVRIEDGTQRATGKPGSSSYLLDKKQGVSGTTLHLTIVTPKSALPTPEVFVIYLSRGQSGYRFSWLGAVGH